MLMVITGAGKLGNSVNRPGFQRKKKEADKMSDNLQIEQRFLVSGHEKAVTSVKVSPGGAILASTGMNDAVSDCSIFPLEFFCHFFHFFTYRRRQVGQTI